MRLPIFTMLISSIVIAFFISFVVCYILAKVTSMPSRRKDMDYDKLAGAIYHAKVDNLKLTPKLSTVKVATKEYDNGVESKSIYVKNINVSYEDNNEKKNP